MLLTNGLEASLYPSRAARGRRGRRVGRLFQPTKQDSFAQHMAVGTARVRWSIQ